MFFWGLGFSRVFKCVLGFVHFFGDEANYPTCMVDSLLVWFVGSQGYSRVLTHPHCKLQVMNVHSFVWPYPKALRGVCIFVFSRLLKLACPKITEASQHG